MRISDWSSDVCSSDLRQFETVALPQLRRTIGAMQDENRLAVRPFNMDISGTMIVRIDHDPQAIYAQDSRHCRTSINNPHPREEFRLFADLLRLVTSPIAKEHCTRFGITRAAYRFP